MQRCTVPTSVLLLSSLIESSSFVFEYFKLEAYYENPKSINFKFLKELSINIIF